MHGTPKLIPLSEGTGIMVTTDGAEITLTDGEWQRIKHVHDTLLAKSEVEAAIYLAGVIDGMAHAHRTEIHRTLEAIRERRPDLNLPRPPDDRGPERG